MRTRAVSTFTVGDLRDAYQIHCEAWYRSPRTGKHTREHLNIKAAIDRFVRFAGEHAPADKIDRHQMREWLDKMAEEELKRDYINACLKKVRAWIKWSCNMDYLPFEVTDDVRRVMPLVRNRSRAKESKPRTPPDLDELARLLPHITNRMIRDVVRLMMLTAARPSELLTLTSGEVHHDSEGMRLVPLQHKTAHHDLDRPIPLAREAVGIVEKYWKPLCPGDYLFPSSRASKSGHLTASGFRQSAKRAAALAGIPDFVPYDIRRAVAVRVRAKVGLDAAQALLGHKRSSTTEIYAPLTSGNPAALKAARTATEVL